MSRNERFALYVSLALNIFFAGAAAIVIGGFLMHGPRFSGHGPFPPPGGGFLAKMLPEDAAQRLEPTLAPKRKIARAAFEEARANRHAAIETLAAQPYSSEASRAAFQKARESDLRAVAAAQDLMADAFLSLNDDERQEAYKKLSAIAKKRDGKWRDKGPAPMMGEGGPPGDAPLPNEP